MSLDEWRISRGPLPLSFLFIFFPAYFQRLGSQLPKKSYKAVGCISEKKGGEISVRISVSAERLSSAPRSGVFIQFCHICLSLLFDLQIDIQVEAIPRG